MDKILHYIENLSLREKLLVYVFIVLCAIFFAFKIYENYLKYERSDFLELGVVDSKKSDVLDLKFELDKLKNELLKERARLEIYKNKELEYKQDFNKFLSFIKEKSQNLQIIDFNQSKITKPKFEVFTLSLSLYGEFLDLVFFLNELEKSDFNLDIEKIHFDNTSDLKLKLSLSLNFIQTY